MGSRIIEACAICENCFNNREHRSVAFPCRHYFCLTCLFRLQSTSDQSCPMCRKDWSFFSGESLTGIELPAMGASGREGSDDLKIDKKINEKYVVCQEHEFPYLFWCQNDKEFCCKECVVENETSNLTLIDDAVPLIKADIRDKVDSTMQDIQTDIDQLEVMSSLVKKKRSAVTKYKEEVHQLEQRLTNYAQDIERLKANRMMDLYPLKTVQSNVERIKAGSDIAVMQECLETVNTLKREADLPSSDDPETLLCRIACAWVKNTLLHPQAGDAFLIALVSSMQETTVSLHESPAGEQKSSSNLQASASSLHKSASSLQESPATISSGTYEAELAAAGKSMQAERYWIIDNNNSAVGIYALCIRQFHSVALVARDDVPYPLPAAAVGGAARAGCIVRARFLDTFLCPGEHTRQRDGDRLERFLNIACFSKLVQFYGHLDAANVAKLPHTITSLHLAICSAADARAISSLVVWENLCHLGSAVSSSVAVQDLLPLPRVKFQRLYFYGLEDDAVERVRAAIDALLTNDKLQWLWLPKCRLTAAGAVSLAQQLRGLNIYGVTIDTSSGLWRPDQREREETAAVFMSCVNSDSIIWDMDLLYTSV